MNLACLSAQFAHVTVLNRVLHVTIPHILRRICLITVPREFGMSGSVSGIFGKFKSGIPSSFSISGNFTTTTASLLLRLVNVGT